ncbi:sugar phosphate nucleotidyltransferase [Patescibacteria group bacterium]
MKKELVAVVLAGGVGSRFWPFVSDKALFPFMGKPFIESSVLDLLPKEVSKVVIIANNVNQQKLKSIKLKIPIVTIVQPHAKGMADALLMAKNQISGAKLLIFIADHLVEKSLIKSVLDTAKNTNSFGVLAGYKTKRYFPGGYLKLKNNKITGVEEKPGEGNEPSPYVYITGNYIDDSDILLSELSKTISDKDDVFELALTKLMHHTQFTMVPYEGISASLKFPWDTLAVMTNLLEMNVKSKVGSGVIIKENVFLDGPVFIGDNVKIFENTKIIGPTYIGDNSIIGNNNIIRSSHIGKNCITGFNTDITRSYVGDNCWFHSNYIGDSVLESDISLGSGSVLANLRLDEKTIASFVKNTKQFTEYKKLGSCIGSSVRIGVNASVMPGIKIGANSFISAGVCLSKDVSEGSFVTVKQNLQIRKNKITALADRDVFRKKI